MWQKLDRLLGQKCCVFCGRSPTDPGPAVQVELVPPDAQKAVANGVVPPANGHVPNGLVGSGRPPQPGPHGAGPGVYQDTRVQLTGAFQPATSSSAGFFSRPAAQNGGAQPSNGGEVSRATAGPPHVQQQGAYQQREAPRQTVSWGPPDPAGGWAAPDATRPTSGHAGGPPAASLRHPYQPSPSKQPVPPSSAAGTNGGQQSAAVTSRPDGSGPGTGTNRATVQWGAQVPPPAYSLPRQQQQQRPAEQAPPSTAATLPTGMGHDRSRPGEPPTAAGVTNGEAGFISDLKAGDLLGRTNEELVLLLIQLRRQAAAAAAARDRVSRQLDRAVAEAGGSGRQTEQTERLRAQMARLDSQHQLTRPLITLVDNMLKLSSLRGSRGGPGGGAGGPPPPGETSEPPAATLAPPSGQNGDSQDRPPVTGEEGPVRDSERLLQRQRALQDELTRVKAVLSSSAKTLDETAADNSRLEREMLSLRQRLQAALKATSHGSSYSNEVRALEAEVRRVQRMLTSRQAERRAPGPEESRRSGSVRRPPEEPAPLHRAGSARLPAGYEAQYDEQSLMNPPLDRHAPPPPAPPTGQYHPQADRRQHQSNGAVRPGPGGQTASPPDSGGAGRQQRPGSRRGLPKSVSGPLSGDYDSLYDSPYDAVYDRPNGYDPPPYVPPAPPPAGADQWRGADWPGRAGGAAYPPSRHDWNRDGRGGSTRHRAGSQQDVRSALGASQQDMRSALTASQQDMRSALTASQQDMRSALAASYQAYRRASGALADGGDSERRLQAVLRQYRSQQDLGSAGDSAGRYGPYRHTRGLSYGQEMAGAYYQERGGRHGYVPEHRRSYSHLHEREVPAYERRQSVHHFGETHEMDRSLPRTHEPRERERSLPRSYEPRERDQSLPRDYHHREQDHSLPRNYEHHHSLPQGYNHEDHHQGPPRHHDPSYQPGRSQEPAYQSVRPHEPPQQYTRPPEPQQYARPPEHSQQYTRPPETSQQFSRPPEPSQQYARPHDPVAEAVVTQPSPLRPLGDPNGRHPSEPSDVGGGPLLHRQGGAFQPYQADHGPGRGGGQDRWRQNGGQDEPVYAAVRKGPSRGAGGTLQDRSQQQQLQQEQHQQHQQQHQHQHQQQQQQQEKDYYDHQQMQQAAQRHQQMQQDQHNNHYYQQQQQEEQQQYQHQQNHSQQQNSHHQNHYSQHHHQQQHLPVDGSPYHRPDGEAPLNRPRSPIPPGDRQAAEEHWRTKGPSGPNSPHGNGSVPGPLHHPVQQNGQQLTNESQNRSPPSGKVQTSSFQGNGTDPAKQRSPQQPTPQSAQGPTSATAEQLEETPELTARPAPTGAESQQSAGGRAPQEETGTTAGTATEAATDGATEPSGVDTRSVGTVGQRVAVWESKGPATPAPSGQSNGNGSSGGQQRQQTGGTQEMPEEDQAEEYQTQEAMGPLYALLARDRGSLEVKTVRTVKRESQQRQREKGRQASLENVPSGGEVPSDGEEEDPLVTDPVLSQFQRALSLPRGYGGRRASEQDSSQQRHHMLKRLVDQRRPAERRPSAYERLFGSTPELRAAAGPTGAAAERQDLSLRRVPRRHHTLSVGTRLAARRLSDAAAAHGASAEELPTEPRPPLRQASSTPDIVRASRPGLATKYDEDTIDKLLARPQKIRIPERYVPELEVEPMSVEERLQRSRKAASIRKMLTQSTGFLDTIGSQTGEKEPRVRPGVAATDKLQRAHLLQLNEILARQVTEQSKRVAAANSSPE